MRCLSFDPFVLEYERVTAPLHDFKQECILAAQKAKDRAEGRPIAVLMSGGIDSELIAQSLLWAGIPFRAVIGQLVIDGPTEITVLNQHDIEFATRWCERNSVVECINVSLDVYQRAVQLSHYAYRSKGFSPQYAWHMWLMACVKSWGMFPVAGLGDIDIRLIDGEYFCCDTQREWSIDNFCQKNEVPGIIRFCKQDSRMTAAYLQIPMVKQLMQDCVPMLADHKHEILRTVFEFEPRIKQTGFERLQEWDALIRDPLKKVHGHLDNLHRVPVYHFEV